MPATKRPGRLPVCSPFSNVTTPLFTVVDLSTVWVVADVYETDFARIRVGTSAAITAAAYPGMTLSGRVAYIDPQVRPDTRTAKIRIEVPNTGGRLKLGMFVDGRWYLDLNGNSRWDDGDLQLTLGSAGDLPVVGDWNQDGNYSKDGLAPIGGFDATDQGIQVSTGVFWRGTAGTGSNS